MLSDKEIISRSITILRFPLIVCVCFIHSKTTSSFNVSPIYYCLSNLLSEGIARIAVPLFFTISGYLFFNHMQNGFLEKIKKRVKSLFIPMLLWDILAVLFMLWVQTYNFTDFIYRDKAIADWNISDYISSIYSLYHPLPPFTPPYIYPFWFIRDLFITILFSPILYWCYKRFKIYFITLLGLLWFIKPSGGLWFIPLGAAPLFFFELGAYFTLEKQNIVSFLNKKSRIIYILYLGILIIDLLTKTYSYNIYIHRIGILIGSVAVCKLTINYAQSTNKLKVWEYLSTISFFVFAFHEPYMSFFNKIVWGDTIQSSNSLMILSYILNPLLIIVLAIILQRLLKLCCPKFLSLLSGERI